MIGRHVWGEGWRESEREREIEIHVHYDAGDEAQAIGPVVRRRGTGRRGARRRWREVLEVGDGQVDVGVDLPLAEQGAGTLVPLDAVFLGRSSLDFDYTSQFPSDPEQARGSISAYVVSIGVARSAEHDVGLDGAERLGDGGGLDGASPPAAGHGGGCWDVLAVGSNCKKISTTRWSHTFGRRNDNDELAHAQDLDVDDVGGPSIGRVHLSLRVRNLASVFLLNRIGSGTSWF